MSNDCDRGIHTFEPWKHRGPIADHGAEECRWCGRVRLKCMACGRDYEGFPMRATEGTWDTLLLCVDCWQGERRLTAPPKS